MASRRTKIESRKLQGISSVSIGMYFNGPRIAETGSFPAILVKRELYTIMHKQNLEWVRDTISCLKSDLIIHSAVEQLNQPIGVSKECKRECECQCYCGKRASSPRLQCPQTIDGRPHRLETCRLELDAFLSLEIELAAETTRLTKASAQKSELMIQWAKDGATPAEFT